MKLESKLFDSIRVKPDEDRRLRDKHPSCAWHGCEGAGMHKAPKGRGREGQYHLFCIDHVRSYNKAYNYFDGMKDEDVVGYQRSAATGHRPTWKVGKNPHASDKSGNTESGPEKPGFADPFEIFDDLGMETFKPRRTIRNAERRALNELGLDENATAEGIKAQYKLLVKRHHPDANGGRRESEEKFREVVKAHNYLRSIGFC